MNTPGSKTNENNKLIKLTINTNSQYIKHDGVRNTSNNINNTHSRIVFNHGMPCFMTSNNDFQ